MSQLQKIVFFGTPSFAAQILKYLVDHGISIYAVVTQPDRPQGRNLQIVPSAVKVEAQKLISHANILQPEKASDDHFLKQLEAINPDLFVVVAYGQILPQRLLNIPRLGSINVHASLLPKYRGAAPIQRCLMNGDLETGVSIQKIVYQLDAGDVIDEAKTIVGFDTTFGELEQRLCDLSQPLLLSVIKKYQTSLPSARIQDSKLVTFASKIKPEETEIRWNAPAVQLHHLIRALSPRPGAWCWIENGSRKRLKILRASLSSKTGSPGELLLPAKNQCYVCAIGGSLELLEVQMEGKKSMSAAEWIRGWKEPPRLTLL